MRERLYGIGLVLCLCSAAAMGSLTPIGDYTLTLARDGWSETKTMSVQAFPTPQAFYQVGGQDVNVYLQDVGQYGINDQIDGFTWYVNAPAVQSDSSLSLLGGTGDLTITVEGLKFSQDPNVHFVPLVTHIYYVDSNSLKMNIPGHIPVSPGIDQIQRSPILPVTSGEPDYNPSDAYYGTPYQDNTSDNVTFVLPEMYVPSGAMWELSFGAGFVPAPEPTTMILLLLAGLAGLKKRR